jgi:hypothetical protein
LGCWLRSMNAQPANRREHFREHAAWTRDLAAGVVEEDVRRHLLEVADRYDRIADRVKCGE